MKSTHTIPIAIILGGILIAIAMYVSIPKFSSTGSDNSALVRPVDSNDHILGNPAAKVMIVEYADFDCEYCVGTNTALRQIIANEGANGDVALVYREFPLVEIHPNAMHHAEAAECVAQTAGNDAFWKFTDVLFAHQPVDPAQYGTFAATVGVTGDAFATCFANAATTVDTRIKADRQNALDIGAIGTPHSLIVVTGKPPIVMAGKYPYDAIKQLVDQALAKTK